MCYRRPNDQMIQELQALFLFWYLPAQAAYGWSEDLGLEYAERQAAIRAKYEPNGT